jgi:hypothetical protein
MTKMPVPYPHPNGVIKPHDYRHCDKCQAFIAMGGPALQRPARKFNEVTK